MSLPAEGILRVSTACSVANRTLYYMRLKLFLPILTSLSAENFKRLMTSESLNDLSSVKRSKGGVSWNVESPFMCTPPGTPPPPYRGNSQHQKENSIPSPPIPPPPDEANEAREDDVSSEYVNIIVNEC